MNNTQKNINGVLAILALLYVSFLWKNPLILFLILLFLSGLILKNDYSKDKLKIYIMSSLSGGVAESLAVLNGAWKYSNPDTVLNTPLWLFPLWGIAAVFLVNLHQIIKVSVN